MIGYFLRYLHVKMHTKVINYLIRFINMNARKTFLSLLALSSVAMMAQKFDVVDVKQLASNVEMYHPLFTPDGKQLLVTSEAYDGLGIIDIDGANYRKLTDARSAGYYPAVSADGTVVTCRELDEKSMTLTLMNINLATGNKSVVDAGMEHFNHINLSGDDAVMGIDGKMTKRKVKSSSQAMNNVFVTEEDLKLVVYRDGERTVVDPLSTPERDVNYCWSSLSPDKRHLLFVGGNNAYVSDLDGSNLVNLGRLHAPVWRGNDYVVAMDDRDDGSRFTASDIVIIGIDGNNRQQLTPASSEIMMFPAVSQQGDRIAYHSLEGKVYVMTIKEK